MTRLLVSGSPWSLPRFIPGVFAALADAGAELVFSGVPGKDPVPPALAGAPSVSSVELPLERPEPEGEAVTLLRRIADLARFLDPELANARWPRQRTALRALVRAGVPNAEEIAPRLAGFTLPAQAHATLTETLGGIERLLPPGDELVAAVAALDLDAVVLVSRCSLGGAERDVLKVARALDLPSIMLVWSWDNLSSKAHLNEHPDNLLVWNDLQAGEAERLHGIPRARVHTVGAPNFDDFFAELAHLDERPSRDRATLLYLGSSKNITRQEPAIFEQWLTAVRASADPRVREAQVVVRPYPGGGPWSRWDPPAPRDFVVDRGARVEPARLAALLRDADAVVALNTSAELEAAIAGVPVVTFRAGTLAPGQEGSVHFEYLLERNGGFVVDSRDLDEHVANLSHVLSGGYDRGTLRAFAERFVRPRGLDRPVAPLVAEQILSLAGAPERLAATR